MQEYGVALEELRQGAKTVIESGAGLYRLGISYFVLSERPLQSGLRVWGFMGIYPIEGSTESTFLTAVTDPTKDYDSFQIRALSLILPKRIRKMPIPMDPDRAGMLERRFAQQHIPSKLLVVGQLVQTQEEALALYCVEGVRPAQGLREIQSRLRQKLTERN